jgi:hypothetical protein
MDFAARVRRDDEDASYRLGFLHPPTGWAYLHEPTEAAGAGAFRESLAYLGALQILRLWSRDKTDPTTIHWDRSEDYWFKEGLPAFLASRRVADPIEGQILRAVAWERPALGLVVQRRGPLDQGIYLSPRDKDAVAEGLYPPDSGYTDLAWLLVRHLNGGGRAQFERFLRAQVEGTGKGIGFFEECFGVKGSAGWDELQRATYASIE